MTRTLRYLLLFALTALSGSVIAQEISGTILDDKKQPLPSAVVQVYQGGILKGGNVSDYDGNYTVKPLDPGYYNVLVHYAGYDSIMITGVVVAPGQRTTQNFSLSRKTITIKGNFVVKAYKKPLIDIDKGGDKILTKEEINVIPTTQVNDLVSTAAGVYQDKRGGDLNIGGARTSGTLYIIDGVQVQGSYGIDMAQGGVDQLEVLTSGIPANYGDVSGGVVNITTRGVAPKLTGDVRVQHSIDGYNNNLLSFSIAGPLLKKAVPGEKIKKPVLGFSLSGDFYDDHDRYPDYEEQYSAKPSVLKDLEQNPLKVVSNSNGQTSYYNSSDFITYDSLQKNKITPNNQIREARLNGKLDYQLSENMHIIAGGNFDYLQQDLYSRARELFAASETPTQNTATGRGYIRFTQKFGKANDTSTKRSVISNAYYSLQADYQKVSQIQEDHNFKTNFFDYGYIGKFVHPGDATGTGKTPIYVPLQTDSLSGKTATILEGYTPTPIEFVPDPSHINQNLANYTTEYYNSLNGVYPNFMSQIVNNGASLSNGDEPFYTYGLFYSPGATQSYYQKFNSSQYALTVDASFDLQIGKTKHAIGFGLYYQQRIERDFIVNTNTGTNSLWQEMRQLVSSSENGGLSLDKSNPIFVVNGKQYTLSQVNAGVVRPGVNDTIIYNLQNAQSTAFDQNLRKKLGYSSTQDINIDNLDPSTFSLSMFSADELLNDGGYKSLTQYYGYGYDGSTQTGNVNFNDFWTQKDANGNYTRPIGAFTPNYIAGYLLDKFNYKDVHFNVGLRIDRYSANTKVLKDPYSEYGELTVSQVSGSQNLFNGGVHPANMGGNYVVYVNDNNSSAPSIIGYRNGDNWYDPAGNAISNPALLKQYSNGTDPQPDIVKNATNNYTKITDTGYNPNSAFTDYTPQVLLQPRLSFSFPISEVANFYAHYDIYQHRPTNYVYATAADYYFLQDNANLVISNANLKPEETYDYEVGFQQKLSSSSALSISAFYKERKNMITTVPYIDAFPTTYYTYGNRDFSTTKGTTIFYDLRATNHLRMTLSYTLQFAEGTGSTPTSTNRNGGGQIDPNGLLQSFVEAGLPNLRYTSALDYDSRHNIVANIDYRYNQDEGPMIGGSHVFQNAGVDIIARARSGEPYTRLQDAVGNTVVGGVNTSRLPWHYGVDLRLDKDFALNHVKKHEDAPMGAKSKRQLYLKGILQINNLLNTRDILGVYGYTGRPNDNGYLASAVGQQAVAQQVDPASYSQLYAISVNDPSNLNYARTISLALEFNF